MLEIRMDSAESDRTTQPFDPTIRVDLNPAGTPLPAMPTEVGRADPSSRFGKFIRTQKLGAGGMGEVWKAWDTELHRWVALKFLKGGDDTEIARFRREAQIAGKLSHPNIAAIYEVGQDQQRLFIAMQYVPGRTLDGEPRTDLRRLARLVHDASRAVHFAHEQGVVHRDLKPANLMVDSERIFVLDFGLAKHATTDGQLSLSGTIVGTPGFMSPEQAIGNPSQLDRRSDVYSLGATLYAVLGGKAPFHAENPYQALRLVVEQEPVRLRSVNPDVPTDLATIVAKAMDKEPARRYATAHEFADDLQRWIDGRTILAQPAGPVTIATKWMRRNRVVTATVTIAATLLAAALWRMRASDEQIRLGQLGGVAYEKRRALSTPLMTRAAERCDRIFVALHQPGATVDAVRSELKQALADADQGLALAPDYRDAYYVRARIRLIAGDLDGALQDIGEMLHRQPSHLAARMMRLQINVEREAREEVEADASFLNRTPGTPVESIAHSAALVALVRGDWKQAAGSFTALIEKDRRNVELYKLRGDAGAMGASARGTDRDRLAAEAIADYREAVAMRPAYYEAHRAWARLLNGEERIARLRECVKVHSECDPALAELAECMLGEARRVRDVLECLDSLRRRRTADMDLPLLAGILRLRLGEAERALRDFDDALALQARPEIRADRAVALAFLGRTREAEAAFETLASDATCGVLARRNRATLRRGAHHIVSGDAAGALMETAEIEDPIALCNRAAACLALKDWEGAKQSCERGLKLCREDDALTREALRTNQALANDPESTRPMRVIEAGPMTLAVSANVVLHSGRIIAIYETYLCSVPVVVRDHTRSR